MQVEAQRSRPPSVAVGEGQQRLAARKQHGRSTRKRPEGRMATSDSKRCSQISAASPSAAARRIPSPCTASPGVRPRTLPADSRPKRPPSPEGFPAKRRHRCTDRIRRQPARPVGWPAPGSAPAEGAAPFLQKHVALRHQQGGILPPALLHGPARIVHSQRAAGRYARHGAARTLRYGQKHAPALPVGQRNGAHVAQRAVRVAFHLHLRIRRPG